MEPEDGCLTIWGNGDQSTRGSRAKAWNTSSSSSKSISSEINLGALDLAASQNADFTEWIPFDDRLHGKSLL
jgi:hypothetical protein